MSEEKKYVKVDKAMLQQVLSKAKRVDQLELENAELKGDIDFLLETKTKIEGLQEQKFVFAKLTKAKARGKIPEFLGLDRERFDAFIKKYDIQLPL